MKSLTSYLLVGLKGLAMGAANVVPGVSGGTIAFITGIYEDLINSLKSFDLTALRLLLKFQLKAFSYHVNLPFLISLFIGVGISLVTFGKLLFYLFETFPVYVWSFFFGLIVASVYSVGKTIEKWNVSTIIGLIAGTLVAVSLAFLNPADENQNLIYLILCGVVAICSMLLPGLSGSFVLILMGNYQLIMLQAVPDFNLAVIAPVGVGGIVGFLGLSHLISFLLNRAKNTTISSLTGFILGSLLIIWPWKNEVYLADESGNFLLKDGEKIIETYERFMPDFGSSETMLALVLMVLGALLVILLDKLGERNQKTVNV